jgi:type IV secretion system protein VirD4
VFGNIELVTEKWSYTSKLQDTFAAIHDRKFDITKHKRYKELSDYDKKNEFDVEAYMRHRMEVKLTRTQEFDLYEFSEESLAKELNTENKEAEHVKDSDT